MHPIVAAFRVPVLDWIVQVQAYPLAHLLAFLVLVTVTLHLHARDGGVRESAVDPLVTGVLAGMLGARLLGDWTNGHSVTGPFAAPHAWWLGSRSAYGGLVVGTAAASAIARRQGVPVARLLDAAAPAIAFAACVTRLGCFLAGCCWGRPTASPLAVRFPASHPGMTAGPPSLHPTQLYLAAAALAIGLLLLAFRRRGGARPGTRFRLGAALYALSVFGIEWLRADPGRWFAAGLSHSQWISLLVLVGLIVPRRPEAEPI